MSESSNCSWEDMFYDELAVCAETGAIDLLRERYLRRKQAMAELWAGTGHWDIVRDKLDRVYREVRQDYKIK